MNHDKRISRQADGSWGFRVRVPATREGRQIKRRGFPTAKAAQAALTGILESGGRGVSEARGGATVETFLRDRWLPTLTAKVRETTRYAYGRTVANHLVPHLGAVKLDRLAPEHIETMLAALAAAGLSAKTQRNVVAVLSSALRDARRWKLMTSNPLADVQRPRYDAPAVRAWSVDQLGEFLDGSADERLGAVWRLAALSALRRGELLGLRWDDIELDARAVTVSKQRTTAGGRIIESAPKSASGNRRVSLDAQSVAVLRRWRTEQLAELVALGARPAESFVVTNLSGGPMDPDEFGAQFAALCRRLGVPPTGMHSLRHSSATYLIAQGHNPRAVQQRLGHSDIQTTLRSYTAALPSHDRAAVDDLAAAISGSKENPRGTYVVPIMPSDGFTR